MRIMYIQPAEAFGGAERQGAMHIHGLRARGFHVVPVVGPSAPMARELGRVGVSDFSVCEHLPANTHSNLTTIGNARFARAYVNAFRRTPAALVDLARKHHVDVMVSNRAFGWAVAAPAAQVLNLPHLARIGSRPTGRWQTLLLRMLCRKYGSPAALICNCDAVGNSLYPYVGAEMALVPNGVDTSRFDPARTDRGLRARIAVNPATVLVGLPARPAPGKGLELLADVASRVRSAASEVSFVIAGEFGWRSYYEDLFRSRGIRDQVTFLGHVGEMERFHAACDIVVHTSRARSIEGSPNALLEAMAMERPVLATRVGGVSEIVSDGVDGVLVPDGNPKEFTRQLLALVREPALRRRLGRAARQRIIDVFSEQRSVDRLVEVIDRFSGRCPSTRRALSAKTPTSAGRDAATGDHASL